MDSNPRSPSCRLRDGPVRQNGIPLSRPGTERSKPGSAAECTRQPAGSAGALLAPPRVGRSPPIGLRNAAGEVRPMTVQNSSPQSWMWKPPVPIPKATRSSNSASASSNTTRQSGRIYRVLGSSEWLEDPGSPIPPEITNITGITDEMVAGHPAGADLSCLSVAPGQSGSRPRQRRHTDVWTCHFVPG